MRQLKRGITPGPFIESVYLDRTRIYDPEHYAFNLPSLKKFSKLDLHPQLTFFVGEKRFWPIDDALSLAKTHSS